MILDEIYDEVCTQAGTETASTTPCGFETYRWSEAPGDCSSHGAICRNEPVTSYDAFGLDAYIINLPAGSSEYLGHTAFAVDDPDAKRLRVYHFYGRRHYFGRTLGLVQAVFLDRAYIWWGLFSDIEDYLRTEIGNKVSVHVGAVAVGTEDDDRRIIRFLDSEERTQARWYSAIFGSECHRASRDWFEQYIGGKTTASPYVRVGTVDLSSSFQLVGQNREIYVGESLRDMVLLLMPTYIAEGPSGSQIYRDPLYFDTLSSLRSWRDGVERFYRRNSP